MSEKLYKDAKDVVSSVMENMMGSIENNPLRINERWSEIVGMNLKDFCEFDKVARKILYINVFSHNYTTYVLMNKNNIIKKFNSFYPDLKVSSIKVFCSHM